MSETNNYAIKKLEEKILLLHWNAYGEFDMWLSKNFWDLLKL